MSVVAVSWKLENESVLSSLMKRPYVISRLVAEGGSGGLSPLLKILDNFGDSAPLWKIY